MQCLIPSTVDSSEDELAQAFQSRLRIAPAVGDESGNSLQGWKNTQPFLPPLSPAATALQPKNTLVLDLDETLVHSSFKLLPRYDFAVAIDLDNSLHTVYVLKRPGVDEFLAAMAERFELVVFTASLRKYACPVLDKLDLRSAIRHRLYREACRQISGGLLKDLSALGRDLTRVIIIDNNPQSYALQPENAIPISSFIDDPKDCELIKLMPLLTSLSQANNVVETLNRVQSLRD